MDTLAFVRSGHTTLTGGGVASVGYGGWVWSRTASGNPIYAYRLVFNSTGVRPSDNNVRFYGFPLRCLYPGSA